MKNKEFNILNIMIMLMAISCWLIDWKAGLIGNAGQLGLICVELFVK